MDHFNKGRAAKMASQEHSFRVGCAEFPLAVDWRLGSSFAMNMQIIARGWFVYDLTSSAMDLAWATLVLYVAIGLILSYGGVLADRLPKRRLIVFAQSLNALATLIMAWIIFSGAVVFWDFIWFGFFNGTILALSMHASVRHLCLS